MSDSGKLTQVARFAVDLVRPGDDERPAADLDGGVPVDLTDASGNTLVMLAAYNGQPSTVTPTALDTARMFEQTDLIALLEGTE